MRIAFLPSFRIAAGLLLVVLLGVVGCEVLHWRNPVSPEAILARADEMSWLNSWMAAEPLYRQAELQFTQRRQLSQALYARVSEMPAHSESSTSVPAQIALLTHDLALPEAQEPETRLRVLTILGMLEVNYDAGMARRTWADVEALAIRQHHFLLASRAMGEQGIAAFLLGDIATDRSMKPSRSLRKRTVRHIQRLPSRPKSRPSAALGRTRKLWRLPAKRCSE